MSNCLIIDPCGQLSALVHQPLQNMGLHVESARSPWTVKGHGPYDLVLLNMRRRLAFGDNVCGPVRDKWHTSIVAFIEPQDSLDRVLALELGADAIVQPPFDAREIEARLRSLMRRRPPASRTSPAPRLNKDTRSLQVHGHAHLHLSASECLVLEALLSQPGQIMSRAELLVRSGLSTQGCTLNVVDLAVSRIRKKLQDVHADPSVLQTVRGMGYAWGGTT